jgi:alpha-L-rhamnosidase
MKNRCHSKKDLCLNTEIDAAGFPAHTKPIITTTVNCIFLKMKNLIIGAALILTAGHTLGEPAGSLTVGDGLVNPLGFHDATPVLSWKLPDGVKRQTACRIEAKAGEKSWDSGWVASDQSTLVPYAGEPLTSRQQVEWRVNFRDERGKDSGWSAPAHFELGLLSAKDWQAQWIRPSQEMSTNGEPVANLRRSFPVAKKVARARVYVTACGLFELTLNGTRVGNDHFANGFTSYNKRLDTLTYDVTGQLRSGSNTLQALVGAGWYAGRLTWTKNKKELFGEHPELLLQLEITYADGSRDTVVSDGQWEGTFDGPVVSSSLYDGESYDARKTNAGWKPVVAEAGLGPERLEPKPFPPVREAQTLRVQNISEPEPGRFVFDLGQNMVGWARIKAPAEKDRTITIRFAEMLNTNGTLYTENYRTAKSTDTYTAAKTGTIRWEPHFTFHGFRYVELSGLPAGARPQKDWVTGVVLHSDLVQIGKFESSNAKLNQLQSNIVWGQRGNFVDIPTDCPQRDERLGWTGDAEVFCPTAMFNCDCQAFFKSWLESMRDDQLADGRIPHVIPDVLHAGDSPGWMDAATIIPWEVYVHTGDTNVLADNFAMMEKLVGWYRSQAVGGLTPNIMGYGDWLQPYAKNQKGDTPFALLGTAFYARSAQILADSARVLKRQDEAKRYADEAAVVRQAFFTNYFDANGKLQNAPETQTAYVLAIAFDLIPQDAQQQAATNLVRLIGEANGHLRTGFLGTPRIASVLDKTGHEAVAFNLLFQETYPSWFYPINQGATTMWERWNSYTRDKGFGSASMNSFNHYAYGAIGQWMYERVAGLAPDPANPGYKHFFVRPLIGEQLNSARAELETPYGRASSAWAKHNGKIVMNIVVPPNTTATIEFPDHRKSETVTAGTYRFSLDTKLATWH